LEAVQRGACNILVGTHALVEDTVRFQNLGLVVVDEQHRFGVAQRQALSEKGHRPHVLVMSATPIPRSLAMTVYGNLDVSVVSGLPSGRKPVVTMLLRESDRELMMKRLVEKLRNGEQAFVVFPLVEDSALIDLKSATYGFEQIKRRLPEFNVALLHGRMKRDEREQIMQAFKNREYQVLVATTVVEVGIDVPNASIMIIEHAERFGLAQLHQLRGRVGRGTNASFCYLMAGKAVSEDGWQRLRIMEQTNDGFEIAEADLKIRGPGDFLGTKQSGLPDFVFADLIQDQLLLADARATAEVIFREDPELNLPQHRVLKRSLEQYLKSRMHLLGA
jgi:ATP-dependent DNA helicase RecG